jgi:L-ascorbate metabolism protein UlaG (beta-lactamase superfamily)
VHPGKATAETALAGLTRNIRNVLALLATLAMAMLSGCTAAPAFNGPAGKQFDGTRFVNREPMDKSLGDFVKLAWGAVTEASDWPGWVETSQGEILAERVYQGVSVTFINHATFLIQVDGLNILTDPIYSERASPFQWAGPKRVHAPGIPLEDLPPIDLVLISHNHYDHLDEATLIGLAGQQEKPPLIVAGLGNGLLFDKLGLSNHRDLDWLESTRLGEVEIIFTECRHRSGRGAGDQMKTLWGSFVLKTTAGNLYFAGDTGYGPHLKEAGEDHGPFRLALLPIGAYEPRWFMADVHLNPEEAVRAHLDLRSEHSIGMHFGTFQLTYEGVDQPLSELAVAREKHGVSPAAFEVLEVGETSTFGLPLQTASHR